VRAVVSRVAWARVVADGELTGEIGPGLLVLVGVTHADGEADAAWLAAKVAGLRVFDDDRGVMNRSLAEAGGGALVVSQFTLYGDARRGRRPS
jgi:D-tyrosyl-tRNA(Tyr) deacylase